MNPYFYVSPDGTLFDRRKKNWHICPVRTNYRRRRAKIKNASDLKATLREGGLTKLKHQCHLITAAGEAISFGYAKSEFFPMVFAIKYKADDRIIGCDINWSNEELTCVYTGDRIPTWLQPEGNRS